MHTFNHRVPRVRSGIVTVAVFAAMLAAFSGCDAPTTPTEHETTDARVTVQRQVAAAVAAAMAEPGIRLSVLRAMRASQYSEHKLVLQEFLASNAGAELARFEAGPGIALRELVAKLPIQMDFYVPSDKQRLNWRGTPDVLVATVPHSDAERAIAFGPMGSTRWIVSVDLSDVDAVFVIYPAEAKARFPTRRLGPGTTIAEPGDALAPLLDIGPGGGSYVVCNPETQPWCEDGGEGGGGGGGGGGPGTGTYVNRITVFFGDGVGAGDPEVYWVTCLEDTGGSCDTSATVVTPENHETIVNVRINSEVASSSNQLEAELWESDGGLNGGDDPKGTETIVGTGDETSNNANYNTYIVSEPL